MDPTVVFSAIVIAVPLFKVPTMADRVNYITDPTLLTVAALGLLFYAFVTSTTKGQSQLSTSQKRWANWYLLNAFVFHCLCDCLVGCFHKLPAMDAQYKALDKRFLIDDPVPYIVGLVECSVMAPLCLIAYYGYRTNAWYRPIAEIAVGICHSFGAVVFVACEAAVGFQHVPADLKLEFTMDHCLYFWFGFVFCNLLWVVLPIAAIFRSVQELKRVITVPRKTN